MHVVVDHQSGSRRGRRQVFDDPERVTFGRHPLSDVSFDRRRDGMASARHFELRRTDHGYSVVDVGSSNGTFIGGQSVTDHAVEADQAAVVEVGRGGPRLRIWVGGDLGTAPQPLPGGPGRRRLLLSIAAAFAVGGVIAAYLWAAGSL